MDKMNTKKTLEDVESELRGLLKERDEIDRRVKGLAQIIEGLKTLGEKPQWETPPPEATEGVSAGFTDTVRMIVANAPEPMTPIEIRDMLQVAGFYSKSPKHMLINVYTVLARLKKNDEVAEVRKDGKPAYRCVTPLEAMMFKSVVLPISYSSSEKAKPKKELTHPFNPATYVEKKDEPKK